MSLNAKEQERKTHFRPDGDCSIHIDSTRSKECKKQPCDYRAATDGKRSALESRYASHYEAHHAVCICGPVSYLSFSYDPKVVDKIRAVYFKTEWCINHHSNMKWLPLKKLYSEAGAGKPDDPVWTLDLPCHNWDHNCVGGYTDEVITDLKQKIWDRIRDIPPGQPCFDNADAEKAFDNIVKKFQGELVERGGRTRGTKPAYEKSLKADGERGVWWLPFSMAKTSVATFRPVASFGGRPAWEQGQLDRVRQFLRMKRGG
jgi:hypothetical protein